MPAPATSDRARYDGGEARRRILDAALTVFADAGYDGASTRSIAAAAGMEQGHLAYYYPSKSALWTQVVEAFAHKGELRLREHLPADLHDPVKVVRTALPPFLRAFADDARLTRLMLQEFSVRSPRHDWVVETFGRPVWELLRPLLEALQGRGLLSGASPAVAYFSLIGAALITFGNPLLVASLTGVVCDEGWIDAAVAHMIQPLLTQRARR